MQLTKPNESNPNAWLLVQSNDVPVVQSDGVPALQSDGVVQGARVHCVRTPHLGACIHGAFRGAAQSGAALVTVDAPGR